MVEVLLIVMSVVMLMGCTETVPPGFVGMVMQPSGLTGEVLQPGRHACWGRDDMILIETKEMANKEAMKILCRDDLNFSFDLVIRSRLRESNGKAIKVLLNKQGSSMQVNEAGSRVLMLSYIYATYVSPAARNIARGVVSEYDTTGIRANRASIQNKIVEKLQVALKGTPMELVAAYPSNFDYPKVIIEAVEKKRKKQIEIEEEKAKQAMKLLQAENRKAIAGKLKQVRAAEAEAEAAYIAIVGRAITPAYLKRMEIQAQQELYGRVGAGDKVIVTGDGPVLPMVGK